MVLKLVYRRRSERRARKGVWVQVPPVALNMKYLLCGLVIVLVVLQIFVVPKKSILYQSEIDLIEQQQRMNEYPPRFYRLANILEKRPESRLVYKLENNFFAIFEVKPIFLVLIPLLVLGFFNLIKKHEYIFLLIILGLPILVLTILGQNQKWGNFSLYPFLIICTIYGLVAMVKKK